MANLNSVKLLPAAALLLSGGLLSSGNAIAGASPDPGNTNTYKVTLSGDQSNSYFAGLQLWNVSSTTNPNTGTAYSAPFGGGSYQDPVWEWSGVDLFIDGGTGVGTMQGNMALTYLGDGSAKQTSPAIWSFELDLFGFRSIDGDFEDNIYNAAHFEELLTGNNTTNDIRYDLDIGWTSGVLKIFDDPDQGHLWREMQGKLNGVYNVADLYYDGTAGEVQFGAWYEDTVVGDWGDTKVSMIDHMIIPDDPGGNPNEVSEPATLALIGLGLLGMRRFRKRV